MARTPEQIVDEQVRLWAHQSSGVSHGRESRTCWPTITISREYYASGSKLACVLARRTGFAVWDKRLLQAIAAECGGEERILETLDEHRRRVIDDALRGALLRTTPTNYQYLRALVRVVRTVAAHGSSIIVGRGAQYICDPNTTVRVRLVCPFDKRVAACAREENLNEFQARRKVMEVDAERKEFIRYYYRRDVTNPSDYDIVLNSGLYDLERLAEFVLNAYESKMGRRPENIDSASSARPDPDVVLEA